jgi:DNA-nicking Smr family endonuclease
VTRGRDDDGDDDDRAAFEEAMRGAAPLPADDRRRRPLLAAGPAAPGRARGQAPRASAEAGAPMTVERGAETIAARAAGVDARTLRRLRAAEYPIEATLDLHKLTRAGAERALARFLAAAEARGLRCLLVVHGRGHNSASDGPVLRPAVWDWLTSPRGRPAPLAVVSAPPEHGGSGATLVLLRRPPR